MTLNQSTSEEHNETGLLSNEDMFFECSQNSDINREFYSRPILEQDFLGKEVTSLKVIAASHD